MGIETKERGGRELESGAQVISGQLGKTIQRLRKAYNFSLSDLAEQSGVAKSIICLLYTSPSPRDGLLSRMPSSA